MNAESAGLSAGEIPAEEAPAAGRLSVRQLDVLRLLGDGLTNKDIGKRLGVSPYTVKSHVQGIFAALGVSSRLQAVLRAQRIGLIVG